jgi:cytochrome P450
MELRRTSKSLVVDGRQIPKNWMLWLNVRLTHDNDPVTMEKDGSHMDVKQGFKPERWADKATKPTAWMPFGSGARRCLGENLAMTEMKVFLATLARRVDYDLVGPTDKVLWKRMSVLPRPLDGVEIAPRPAAPVDAATVNTVDSEVGTKTD